MGVSASTPILWASMGRPGDHETHKGREEEHGT